MQTSQEFQIWATRSTANYAKDKMRANNLTEAEAHEIAEKDFLRLLPEGLNTKNNFLFSLKVDEETRVVFLWFSLRGAAKNQKAFLCDIIIEEQYRGKGLGRKALLLAENEAKKLGLKEIGLHVFGFNKPAINLYMSLGYDTKQRLLAHHQELVKLASSLMKKSRPLTLASEALDTAP